jgi:hypothetical protein
LYRQSQSNRPGRLLGGADLERRISTPLRFWSGGFRSHGAVEDSAMGRIRRPSVYGYHIILMKVAMHFNGRLSHDLAVVHSFCREFGMAPEIAIKIIDGYWPSTATNSIN